MNVPQGMAFFPGVNQLIDASITLAHGISPSAATLTIGPQANVTTEIGTLGFEFGGASIEFPDCKVDYGSFERNGNGEVWRLSILDRRWRWRFGQISGTYNVRRDDSSLQGGENDTIDTERTPQELAALCLRAMGETNFDVSDLPNEARPSVEWDYEVPAEALAALCDELGCRVVLQLDNRVAIRRVGVGAALSSAAALEFASLVNPAECPDAIAVVCGPSRFQVDFPLEAVGLAEATEDSPETLLPIDELPYAPSGGWSRVDVPYFHQVDAQSRELARRSVFKYYRIKVPVEVPGYGGLDGNRVDRLEQILPIEAEQVALAVENGQKANLSAAVFGMWYPETLDVANSTESLAPAPTEGDILSASSLLQRPYTIDAARGLVIFGEPIYRNTHPSATGSSGYEVVVGPAELVLRAACSVRHPETMALERHVRTRITGNSSGGATRYLRHDELVLTRSPTYSNDYALVDVDTNEEDVNATADSFLDAAQQEYQIAVPQKARYGGLVPIQPDGAIEHVSFHVGAAGATTTVARHNELPRGALPYKERRRIERQREATDAKTRTSSRNLARASKSSPYTQPRLRA